MHQNGSDGFFSSLMIVGNKVEKRKLRTWQNMLQNVSVVWWFMLIFTICNVYASKWLRRVPFSFFLWLEHGKTWFGRCFCCLVIYANLRKMPKFTMHGKIKQTWEIGKNNKKRVQSTAETNLEHRHQPNYSCVGGLCSKTMCGRPLVDIFNFWVSHFGRSGDILSFSQLLYIYIYIYMYIYIYHIWSTWWRWNRKIWHACHISPWI